jgi:hypothetical protein
LDSLPRCEFWPLIAAWPIVVAAPLPPKELHPRCVQQIDEDTCDEGAPATSGRDVVLVALAARANTREFVGGHRSEPDLILEENGWIHPLQATR